MRIELDSKGLNAHAPKKGDAEIHDRINEAYYGKLGDAFMKKTRERVDWVVKNASGKTVLDVGCSQGIVPILLGKKGFNVTGIDVDDKAIKDAQKYLDKELKTTKENITFIQADFLKLDLSNEKYDSVIFSELLEHLLEPEEFVAMAYKLLSDNGKIIVTVPFGINDHPDHRQNFYLREIYRLLSRCFDVKDVTIFGKWIGLVGAKRKTPLKESEEPNGTLYGQAERAFYEIERYLTDKTYSLKEENVKITKTLTNEKKELERSLEESKEKISAQEKKVEKLNIEVLKFKERAILERKEKERIASSKPYKIINAVMLPARKAYHHSVIGRPLKFTYGLVRPSRKKILHDEMVNYGQLHTPPPDKIFKINKEKGASAKKIRVACIMDDFTYNAFRYECDIKQLTPSNWQEEIEHFQPDFLFVESAWRGKDDLWRKTIISNNKNFIELVRYCQGIGIPTAFWNKEDPAHTGSFLPVASLFDFVFTSDLNCIPMYRNVLQHNRVFVLPFAAQPMINNPIEEFERKDKFNFAGSYYTKYKNRCENFKSLVSAIVKVKGIDIYDRNYDRDLNEKYRFPDEYQEYVKGSLPYDQINKAYKGYNYALTINTVKESPTMFARRGYELLASNTITVSNYSAGIKNMLGDLIVCSDDGDEALEKLRKIIASPHAINTHRLTSLRTVMQQHTYENRFQHMCSKIFDNFHPKQEQKKAVVIAIANNENEAKHALEQFNRQSYSAKELILVVNNKKAKSDVKPGNNITIVDANNKTHARKKVSEFKPDYVGFFSNKAYYGDNYLADLMLATKYSSADYIGKSASYELKGGKLKLKNSGTQYNESENLVPSASIISSRAVNADDTVMNTANLFSTEKQFSGSTLSTDEYNYCKIVNGSLSSKVIDEISAKSDVYCGKHIDEIYEEADKVSLDRNEVKLTKFLSRFRYKRTYKIRQSL